MAASTKKCDTRPPVVGLVEVTLPDSGYALRHVEVESDVYLVGYDPARLTEDIVRLWLDAELPAGYELVQGVPQ